MPDHLLQIQGELTEAAYDPGGWSKALDSINAFVGGSGIVLLSVDERLRHAPMSSDLSEMIDDYFGGGWHAHDCREGCRPLLLEKGIAFDHEFQDMRALEKNRFYAEFLSRHDRKWFVGLGACNDDGLWCLALQRSARKGPFELSETPRLVAIQRLLSQTAALAGAVSRAWCRGGLDAYERMALATIILDRKGQVLDLNGSARLIVSRYIDRSGVLALPDRRYAQAIEALQTSTSASRSTRFELLIGDYVSEVEASTIKHLPLLTISRGSMLLHLKPRKLDLSTILQRRFGLTPSEVKVVLSLAAGAGVADIARSSKISTNTVRTHLKSAFAKTSTGTQSRLVSLVLQLGQNSMLSLVRD